MRSSSFPEGCDRLARAREVLERCRDVEGLVGEEQDGGAGERKAGRRGVVRTGWAPWGAREPGAKSDDGLGVGALEVGGVHEWFEMTDETAGDARGHPWHPPLAIVMHVVRQAMVRVRGAGAVVWIGRRCWPHPIALAQMRGVVAPQVDDLLREAHRSAIRRGVRGGIRLAGRSLSTQEDHAPPSEVESQGVVSGDVLREMPWVGRGGSSERSKSKAHEEQSSHRVESDEASIDLAASSLFVDAHTHEERVRAAELALRCESVAAVVMDGSKLQMSESRRLQIAAYAGGGIGLIARPRWELRELSVARSRWAVRAIPSASDEMRWSVEVLRCKGGGSVVVGGGHRVTVHRDHETGVVGVVVESGRGSGNPEGEPQVAKSCFVA